MDLDDHDQLQNDNGEIDVGLHGNVEKIEREEGDGESLFTNALLTTYFCGKAAQMQMI